jgi:hypothetical protein
VALELRDYLLTDAGVAVAGWTVNLRTGRKTGAPGAILFSTTTDVNGMWEFVDGAAGVVLVAGTKYDVQATSGTHERWWRGYTAIPQEFGDLQIAAAAGILLSKLAAGTANQGVTPDGTAANLDDRINDIVSQLKAMGGLTNWYTAPSTTLFAASGHIGAAGNVHGLPSPASVLGCAGSGQFVKFGTGTTGSETSTGSPTIYKASQAITFSPAFPTACDGVWVTPTNGTTQWGGAFSVTAAGFTGVLSSTNTGVVATQTFAWLAMGH